MGVERAGAVASTQRTELIPPPDDLRRRCRALAAVDVVLAESAEERHYQWAPNWADGWELFFALWDGGDYLWAAFQQGGAILVGFGCHSAMSPFRDDLDPPQLWPGVLDAVPADLAPLLQEPETGVPDDSITFCLWWDRVSRDWKHGSIDFPDGDDPDGSAITLGSVVDTVGEIRQYCDDVYEIELDAALVEPVVAGGPITDELIAALAPSRDATEVRSELAALGLV